MKTRMNKSLLAFALLAASVLPALAASEAEFKTAFDAADAAEKQAGQMHNQWITTEAALASAKKAASSGNFDAAVAAAKEAEALAKASIFQATSEKDRWRELEIR